MLYINVLLPPRSCMKNRRGHLDYQSANASYYNHVLQVHPRAISFLYLESDVSETDI